MAAQTALAKDARGIKKKVEAQNTELGDLQAKVSQLTSSLSEVQTENKSLSAKLAANRVTSMESAASRAPGSAAKNKANVRIMGSVEVAQAVEEAQLKEDIFSDVTGLIIRNVKREEEEDVFDCLQTGRNGSKSSSSAPLALH